MNRNKLVIFTAFSIVLTLILISNGFKYNSVKADLPVNQNKLGSSFIATDLKVNLLSQPLGIDTSSPSFSWVDTSIQQNESQTAYQILVSTSLNNLNNDIGDLLDTGKINSTESSYIKLNSLSLSKDTLYYWKVRIWNRFDLVGSYSTPEALTTATTWSGGNTPTWVNSNSDFTFLRNEFKIADKSKIAKAIISVTASSPEITRQYVYNLFLNANSIGMGPARSANVATEQQYNTYDVTNYLQNGNNSIGILNYTTTGKQFLLQMKIFYTDGTSTIIANSSRDVASWKALDGTKIFGESNSLGTGYYTQAAENIDARIFPYGWDSPGFNTLGWSTPVKVTPFTTTLVPSTVENESRYISNASKVIDKGNGDYFIDLGKEIVGGIKLNIASPVATQITINSGEQLSGDNTVKWQMNTGNIYQEKWTLKAGIQTIQNYSMKSFRYVEILNSPVVITTDNIKSIAIRQQFNDAQASFSSSNSSLNQIYDLVKYSVEATNQNLYVDSQSRERATYEGDGLINMLSSYAMQSSYALPRYSIQYLTYNRTWPAEYKLMYVMMIWNDYLYTGNMDLLKRNYATIKNDKLNDGLFDTKYNLLKRPNSNSNGTDAILLDWPANERDNYDLVDAEYNTVFNSFAYASYLDMSKISTAIGNASDTTYYANRANALQSGMIKYLYNTKEQEFSDGLTSAGEQINHFAQHASVFPLALGVVNDVTIENSIVSHIKADGIKGSIYEGFFVLQALYNSGADQGNTAMDILTSTGINSWMHVIDLGTTITPEDWDPSLKSNMTFSHPWGSAPASQLTSGMFGIHPLSPGFTKFQIKFQPGDTQTASIKTPTIKGSIEASYTTTNSNYIIDTTETVPVNTFATVYIPTGTSIYSTIVVDGRSLQAVYQDNYIVVQLSSGKHEIAIPRS